MNIDPNIVLAVIAVSQLGTALLAYLTRRDAAATKVAAAATQVAAEQTEKNTNSMKDALVLATKQAAHAAGHEEARLEGEATAATLAQGMAAGQAAAIAQKQGRSE